MHVAVGDAYVTCASELMISPTQASALIMRERYWSVNASSMARRFWVLIV